MNFHVISTKTSTGAHSPIQVVEQSTGKGVAWINRYLDREYVRRLADKSLYSYAHSLLHFVRWWESVHHTGEISAADLTESTLFDYVRLLPLAPETTQLLDHYLRVERPDPCSAALFVVLKGPARGQRMTPAGLRSLFRHHRRTTGVQLANPHRFRHTFASDMVRAGISLPALMQLMGHADIETTMHYVKVSPQDVYLQYARAAAQCIHPQPRIA
jgi:hypothetical protein